MKLELYKRKINPYNNAENHIKEEHIDAVFLLKQIQKTYLDK